MIYSIGVDPGDSTGIGIIDDHGTHDSAQGAPDEMVRHLRIFLALIRHGSDVTRLRDSVHIYCERYVSSGRGGRTHQPTAQRVTGVVEALAAQHGVPFTLQSPGDAKHFAPNTLLKTLGMHTTGRDVGKRDANDANDATRHALLGFATDNRLTYDALLRAHDL